MAAQDINAATNTAIYGRPLSQIESLLKNYFLFLDAQQEATAGKRSWIRAISIRSEALLQALCAGLVHLLRGNFYAERLRLEKERLEVTRRLTQEQKDEEFEEWLKRPDVKERMHPKVSRDRAVERMWQILDHCLMGGPLPDCKFLDDPDPELPEDPAAMI